MTVEKPDLSALTNAGCERLSRGLCIESTDGQDRHWGVIYRPRQLRSKKKVPVIENIYWPALRARSSQKGSASTMESELAELGFIVVQIDRMGLTSNRSKAFHDVAFKNLGDAGLPRPHYSGTRRFYAGGSTRHDITRVGIYGTSAGGPRTRSAGSFPFIPSS